MTDPAHGDMNWLLEEFAKGAPGVVAALVTSRDGIAMHQYQLDSDAADRISAIVSGAASLGRGLSHIPGLDLPPAGTSSRW
ncbi:MULTISPECIES: roadblock/LC7 domain-containing protein [unclassified Streptomyces]|uniref:roadblock/LC7 domain-containing protein n=1 Tax=unclassified Streptomyces TaxID=2593676 RepID=UPI00380E7412